MFAAIEGAAEERAALVDGAAGGTEVDTLTVGFCGEEKDGRACFGMSRDAGLVGIDVIALRWMQQERLIGLAAFGAGVAGNIGVFGYEGVVGWEQL